ncbi:hypothetical protein [Devosia enhydra]|nr:hypothetical protein [Devosia enhydra]
MKRHRNYAFCHAPMTRRKRKWVDYQAEKAVVSAAEYLGQVIAGAVVPA